MPSRWYELQISCLTLRQERMDERRCIIRVIDRPVLLLYGERYRACRRKALHTRQNHENRLTRNAGFSNETRRVCRDSRIVMLEAREQAHA